MSLYGILKLSSQFYKLAIKLDELLPIMNLKEDIVEFLQSLPNDKKSFYIAELRKNPNININELKNIKIKEKYNLELTEEEKTKASSLDKDIKNWFIKTILKIRNNKNLYNLFLNKIDEIKDWKFANHVDISSFTAEQAIQFSDKWHADMVGKGENKFYVEGNRNVVYGPKWENKEFNGWTIRKILTKNDLSVEGYKMDHCVGGYGDSVEENSTNVYSLRDPSNGPHVTLGTDGQNFNFFQIKGHSNQDPKPLYKQMIKEWFQFLKKQGKRVICSESEYDIDFLPNDWHRASTKLDDLMHADNDYDVEGGFIYKNNADTIFSAFNTWAERKETNVDDIAEKLVEIMYEKDKILYEELSKSSDTNEQKMRAWRSRSGIKYLIGFIQDSADTFNEYMDGALDYLYENLPKEPEPNDYEFGKEDEEYLYDVKMHERKKEKLKNEYENEYKTLYPYNFADSIEEEIRRYQATAPIPAESWMGHYNWGAFTL